MSLTIFLSGATLAVFAFSGVFFLKFWKASRDRFFLLFCIACWLLAFERVALFVLTEQHVGPLQAEVSSWIYIIRLLAFGVILTAVVVKNRNKP